MLFLMFQGVGANATIIEFSTVSISDNIGTYSIIFSDNEALGLPDLGAGDSINLDGIGDMYNGLYYIDNVSHSFDQEGYHQTFTVERETIVNEDGQTDVSFLLVDYQFSFSSFLDTGTTITRFEFATIPEPGILTLLGLGLAGIHFARRNRKS